MKKIFLFIGLSLLLFSCKNNSKNIILRGGTKDLDGILTNYWEQRMQLFPLEATANGYNRYNDKLTITISSSFRDSLKGFYRKYLEQLLAIDSSKLDAEHKISFRIFRYELQMDLEELRFPDNLMPINQFWAFTLDLPQLGSGQGNQPFKTVKDYNDFLKRLSVFPEWTDTAIFNMRQGIKQRWVLPRPLAEKVLPQLKAMIVKNVKESIFYSPISKMPDSFSANDKKELAEKYINA